MSFVCYLDWCNLGIKFIFIWLEEGVLVQIFEDGSFVYYFVLEDICYVCLVVEMVGQILQVVLCVINLVGDEMVFGLMIFVLFGVFCGEYEIFWVLLIGLYEVLFFYCE